MSALWYGKLLWFLVAVSLLVTVHEFGHYWVARRLGFKVLRFSVGFGRPLLKRVWGDDRTEYVLAAIPLGGYVKLLDEREGNVASDELPRSFTRRPVWQRIVVLLAGPAFNIGFAVLLLWGMFWVSGLTEVRAIVGDVKVDSPAAAAGLASGDEIVALDGRPVSGQRDVLFGLLDDLSGSGRAALTLRDAHGATRSAALVIADADARRRLTEPNHLFEGIGFQFRQPPIPAVVGTVTPGGPADRAGLREGDEIVAIDGEPIADFRALVARISAAPGASVAVAYRRGGAVASTRLTIASELVDGRTIGRIQVTPALRVEFPKSMLNHTDLSLFAALGAASREAWDMTMLQARLFTRMLLGQVSLKNLSGPLSIAEYAGESAAAGFGAFVGFLVLISLSLGFLNLLPIPILDGGQIVFQLIEGAKGSPLSERAQALGQQLGILLLLALMGVALFNDFARQFG
ncbi:MAG: Regulator of sigma-E protease RseP [Steroidobacteraceae bacterium]|nr:Regulator of sigma-E protease RseP [Steroidobacteraceae bacterium]